MTETIIQLSNHARSEIDRWIAKYPVDRKQSAVLAAMREVQHENHGYLTTELIGCGWWNVCIWLAYVCYEVVSFYSMLETEKCGRHSISVCTNISCMLNGSGEIMQHIEKKLGIKEGESTEDGRFHIKQEEECLAACCGAPMMMVDHVYHENLTPEKVDEILDKLE